MKRFTHAALAAVASMALAGPAPADVLDPLDAGEKLLFLVVGVQNDESADDEIATAFWCTNIGKAPIVVTIELYDDFGNPAGTNTQTLTVGETETWVTQDTNLAFVDEISTPSWADLGSARITAIGKGIQILCTAAVLDADDSESTAYMRLPVIPGGKTSTKIPVRKN